MDKEGTNRVKLPHLRLFVLGAGFSQPAGLPLAKDLLERVREGLRMIYGNKHNPFEQEICEWAKLYPGQTLELERVLGFSHRKHHLRLSGSDEDLEYASLSIYAIQKEIQRELLRTTPSKDTIPTLYREFAECLTVHDVVLPFNYDTLLEQSFDLIGKPYSLIPEWKLEKTSGELDAKYVDILKPHGSIDWYDRSYHDERQRWYTEGWGNVPDRDPIFGPTPSVPSEPLSPATVSPILGPRKQNTLLTSVFRVPDFNKHFPVEDGRYTCVVPFILPPAYDKLLGYDLIIDLWDSLHRTLDSFSSINIIGYSMPQYDSYVYEALGKLMIDYQRREGTTYWGQRRVPIQLITRLC